MIGIENLQRAIQIIINGPNGFLPSLYEKGLAYEAEMLVNFCPALGTVLANEEVENGHSKEGGISDRKKAFAAMDVENYSLCRSAY